MYGNACFLPTFRYTLHIHSLTHSFSQSVSQSMCVFAGQSDTSLSQSSSVDVFWCDLDGLQTVCCVFWHVRHIIIIGNSTETPKKNIYISTAYYFHFMVIWSNFFSRAFYAQWTKQIDWMNETTVQTVVQKMCVIVTHKYHVTQFLCCFVVVRWHFFSSWNAFYFPVQCFIHTYFSRFTRALASDLKWPMVWKGDRDWI